MCLPHGKEAFVNSFNPSIMVHSHVTREVIEAIEKRINGIVCQLGLSQWPYGKPVDWDACATATNLGELRAFIRGFAMGVSETVCDLMKNAEDASTQQSASPSGERH
jgi:hypothetical protein